MQIRDTNVPVNEPDLQDLLDRIINNPNENDMELVGRACDLAIELLKQDKASPSASTQSVE